MLREFRLSFFFGAFLWLPHYWWGVHINREVETIHSHNIYEENYGPRRNRLTHSLLFEQFEVFLENWEKLEEEHTKNALNGEIEETEEDD